MFFKIDLAQLLIVISLMIAPCAATGVAQESDRAARPAEWARPVSVKGVPNLHQVENNLYRSAQPDAQGFKLLATQFGVRTVVSLRAFNSDEPLVRGINLRLVRFKIHTWHIERED